jgi:membrane-bound lytic murein transglycosylase C
VKLKQKILEVFLFLFTLLILPLSLDANEIDLSQYEVDVQNVLLDMAVKDPTILSLSQDENSSVIVDFRQGIIEVNANSLQALKKSIVKTLLTQVDPNDIDPNTAHDFGLQSKSGKPFFYKQILDQEKKAIYTNWRALRFADYLIASSSRDFKDNYKVRIYLSSAYLSSLWRN